MGMFMVISWNVAVMGNLWHFMEFYGNSRENVVKLHGFESQELIMDDNY
jgi:hypothetical protein